MKKNFFFYLMPSLLKGSLGILLLVPVTTYYLDPEDFGIAAILGMLSGLIIPLSSTGATWVLSAHYYKQKENDRKELLFNILFLDIVLKVILIFLFLLAAETALPLVVKGYDPEFIFYFQLSLFGILLSSVWPTISYAIVLKKKAKAHAVLETGQYLAGVITTIVCLALLKLGTVTLFIAPIATGLFSFTAGFWYMQHYIIPRIRIKWLKEIFKVGMPTIPLSSFVTVTRTLDRFFIQRWLNLSQLGIYAHSKSYEQVFSMGTKAFSHMFVPEVLQTYNKNEAPGNLKKMLTAWYGLLGIAGLFVTLFSYDIIDILTHGKFVAAAPLVPIWFMLMFSYTFGMPYSQYLIFHKKNSFLVYSGIIISTISVGVSALFIYKFGIMGAVSAAVLSNLAIQICRSLYAKKIGCARIAEKEFLSVVAVMLGVYIINIIFTIGTLEKIIDWLFLSISIAYYYGLITVIRDNGQRVFEFITKLRTRNY